MSTQTQVLTKSVDLWTTRSALPTPATEEMIRKKVSVLVLVFLAFVFLVKDIELFHLVQSMRFDSNTSSAFPAITAKRVMSDHVNSYVMSPLSQSLESTVGLTERFPSLTANQVSVFGVFVAAVAAKVVIDDRLYVRRLAVFIFLLRQFVDDLDGLVARVRMGLDRHLDISVTGSVGYAVDGICDAIGFALFVAAVFAQSLRKKNSNSTSKVIYKPLDVMEGAGLSSSSECTPTAFSTTRLLVRNHVLFGLQMALSCLLWNRYIDAFHRTLETEVTPQKVQIFRSGLQWTIMWLWRCYGNAHQLMNFFLVAVWTNRAQQFLDRVHALGFVAIFGLAFLTEVHVNDIASYLRHK